MPRDFQNEYKLSKSYSHRIHLTKNMPENLKTEYEQLNKLLIHEGWFVDPSYRLDTNTSQVFSMIDLNTVITLDEPTCPRFVV